MSILKTIFPMQQNFKILLFLVELNNEYAGFPEKRYPF